MKSVATKTGIEGQGCSTPSRLSRAPGQTSRAVRAADATEARRLRTRAAVTTTVLRRLQFAFQS